MTLVYPPSLSLSLSLSLARSLLSLSLPRSLFLSIPRSFPDGGADDTLLGTDVWSRGTGGSSGTARHGTAADR